MGVVTFIIIINVPFCFSGHFGTARITYCIGKASFTAMSGLAPMAEAIALIAGSTFSLSGSLKILGRPSTMVNRAFSNISTIVVLVNQRRCVLSNKPDA